MREELHYETIVQSDGTNMKYLTAVYCFHNFSEMDFVKLGKIADLSLKFTKSWLQSSQKNSLFTSSLNHTKFFDATRQSKIFGKLYGERLAGRKKRWFPTQESNTTTNLNLTASNIGKPIKNIGGKGNVRRNSVLNKLFMQHITDLLATGEASEHVLNRNLQITRVKTSIDFTIINVYWLGSGNPAADAELEKQLRRVSGLLRHELSQLELMGNVPRIHFVLDRSHVNLLQITDTLNKLDSEDEKSPDLKSSTESVMKSQKENAKKEFFGENTANESMFKELPRMRQDVFGLNHEEILMKILTKMRKSKRAWNIHNKTFEPTPSET